MIAHAKRVPRIRQSSSARQRVLPERAGLLSTSSLQPTKTSKGGPPRPARPASPQGSSGAKRRELQTKRAGFFARSIDYIPCPEFLQSDAETLATQPPPAADVPLDQSGSGASGQLAPYLISLYRTRLLKREEEQFYFRRMNWLKFRAAAQRDQLDQQRATLRQMERVEGWLAEAETVKAILITSNLRLVVSIAKKFVDASNSFEELVGEGNVALMRSVEKFNFELGNRFSTYATYAIQRHFFRLSHKGRQQRSRFVADDASLHRRAAPEPSTAYCSSGQIDLLKDLFATFFAELEPREQQIVSARFGFDGQPPRTFRELGIEMGVCKERIRQIQSRAMEKIRSMAEEAKLEQMVGDWL